MPASAVCLASDSVFHATLMSVVAGVPRVTGNLSRPPSVAGPFGAAIRRVGPS